MAGKERVSISKKNNGFGMYKGDDSPYWTTHRQVVHLLAHLGLKYRYEQRLPIFQLFVILNDWKPKNEYVKACLDLLTILTELRHEGLEPAHKGNKYI